MLIPAGLYHEVGGYRPLALMEDVDLAQRLGRRRTVMLRSRAVTSAARSSQLPNVPTLGETLNSPPVVTYNGLLAPGRTPNDIIDAIAREIAYSLESGLVCQMAAHSLPCGVSDGSQSTRDAHARTGLWAKPSW